MLTRKHKRIEKVEQAMARMPIRDEVVQKAYDEFCSSGTLPELPRLAACVTDRALVPKSTVVRTEAEAGKYRANMVLIALTGRSDNYEPDPEPTLLPVRDYLFDEAVWGPNYVKQMARAAIEFTVDCGGDVTDTEFAAAKGYPTYGTVGTHVLGVLDRLACEPYEQQACRLFTRYSDIQEQIKERGS